MNAMTESFSAQTASLQGYAGQPCLVFPATRSLGAEEAASLLSELNRFLSGWASHGAPVDGAGALVDGRFVVVAHRPSEIAGCSRDALLFFLKEAGAKRGVEWTGGARVFYRDRAVDATNAAVIDVDRPAFRALAASGAVTPDTVVYDTTVRETDAVLGGPGVKPFALPARESWHARLAGFTG
jgi:hypothetical protein